jgi:hypothetical protein
VQVNVPKVTGGHHDDIANEPDDQTSILTIKAPGPR